MYRAIELWKEDFFGEIIVERRKKNRESEVHLSCDLRLIELAFPSPVTDDQDTQRAVGLGRALEPLQLRGAGEDGEEEDGQTHGLAREAGHDSDGSREDAHKEREKGGTSSVSIKMDG